MIESKEIVSFLENPMTMAKAALAAEITILLILGVVVEWIATRLTHTRNFLPLVIFWGIYLGVRLVVSSRKPRSRDIGNSN